jgi:hypothetical protein
MIIPGLYYIFANIAAKSKLTYYEEENPLTEQTEPYNTMENLKIKILTWIIDNKLKNK